MPILWNRAPRAVSDIRAGHTNGIITEIIAQAEEYFRGARVIFEIEPAGVLSSADDALITSDDQERAQTVETRTCPIGAKTCGAVNEDDDEEFQIHYECVYQPADFGMASSPKQGVQEAPGWNLILWSHGQSSPQLFGSVSTLGGSRNERIQSFCRRMGVPG